MKPHFEQIDTTAQSSFSCKQFILHHFDTPYHFHPEYELTYIVQSSGKRIVGNNIASFTPGDLVLIGKNVPHCWLNEGQLTDSHLAESIVIQFQEDFLGASFFSTPEMRSITHLLHGANRGIRFLPGVTDYALPAMQRINTASPFNGLIELLSLLDQLSKEDRIEFLNTAQHDTVLSEDDCNRIRMVYEFVRLNFEEEIRLEEVAKLVFMTPTSFCRYFKKITRKTFSRFLIEYRIDYARTQLTRTDKSVSEICYESGFRNLAHFNQQFKDLNGVAPREYRKRFQGAFTIHNDPH
jgi:AraC-like DNA-binding protein